MGRIATRDGACRKQERPAQGRPFPCLARPEGFEPPTAWFVARYSIQLSYGREEGGIIAMARDSVKARGAGGMFRLLVPCRFLHKGETPWSGG